MPVSGDRPELSLKTIVYVTDLPFDATNAGLYAACIAAYFSATLLVAHAYTLTQAATEVEIGDRLLSQQRKELTHLLSKETSRLEVKSVEIIPTLLEGDPEDVIPALADRHEPSMIVLGTHGGGRFERGIIGSTAEKILRVYVLAGAYRWSSGSAVAFKDLPIRENSFCDRLYCGSRECSSLCGHIRGGFRGEDRCAQSD